MGLRFKFIAVWVAIISSIALNANAQVYCPPNIDFEQGNFNYWQLFTGSCCPITTPTLSGPVVNRHTITSGTGVDPYGGFPVVMPGTGTYCLKLGNNSVGSQAERAKYFIHIPSGLNNYSIIFRYAVVFQDPSHTLAQQPRFEVKAYDSATNAIINCSQYTYVATANLPGFTLSNVGSNVWYKPWSTASIDLSGYAGRTVVVDFASGDCALGAHFGYGYVDLGCGLFQIGTTTCVTTPTTVLTAPPGFAQYIWKDSALTTTITTGQVANIATPSTTTTYAVILVPYTGYGCPDTLYSTVTVANISVNAGADTSICLGESVQLSGIATGIDTPFIYNWTPSGTLSCSNCTNPVATPNTTTSYILTATNSIGCTKKDTIRINTSSLALGLNKQDVTCFGLNNGSMTSLTTGGISPFSRTWNTTPVQTTTTISNLTPGVYTVTVRDSLGCTKSISDTIKQPTLLWDSLVNIVNTKCYSDSNGSIIVAGKGGTPPYTYTWNTTPASSNSTLANIKAGTYIVLLTDNKGCTDRDTFTITQPDSIITGISKNNIRCFGFANGSINTNVTGGTIPYRYSWNTNPVQTTTSLSNLIPGTYILTLTDTNGCIATDSAIIIQPSQLTDSITYRDVRCNGEKSGMASVATTGGTTPYSYLWNTTPPQATPTANNLQAGNYVVVVTDNNNCTDSEIVIINEPTPLSITANGIDSTCLGFTNGTALAADSGGIQPRTITWLTTPVQHTNLATNLAAGTYIVIVTDQNGCTDNAEAIIGSYPSPVLTVTPDSKICVGDSIKLVATGADSYKWQPKTTLSCDTCSSVYAKPATTTTYNLTGVNNNGCADTAMITVDVVQKKPVGINPDVDICRGEQAQLNATGGIDYIWEPSSTLNNNRISNPVSNADTTTKYKVVITENECFSDTLYQTVHVHKLPTILLPPDQKGVPGGTYSIFADTTLGNRIEWTPTEGLSCGNCINPIASLSKTIVYTATVYNDFCRASDDIRIEVSCENAHVFVPNTFTPNGDGLNDYFWVSADGISTISLFRVYDRWGEKIFEARNIAPNKPELGWDGKYKSQPLTPDVYVYYLEYKCGDNRDIFLKGDISLIR